MIFQHKALLRGVETHHMSTTFQPPRAVHDAARSICASDSNKWVEIADRNILITPDQMVSARKVPGQTDCGRSIDRHESS